MHDLDRMSFEMNDEASQYGESELQPELPGGTFDRPFSEAELDELAMELLQVRDEQELDQFLGSLLSKAAKGIGKFIRSPAGIAFQLVTLAFALYHSVTWFNLTPKALPLPFIAAAHYAIWAALSAGLVYLAS